MRRIIFLIVISLCLFSCKKSTKVEVELYKDGKVKYEKKFLYPNDTLNYTYTEYYNNGIIKDNYKVVNGNIHGRAIAYYQSGNIENISDYVCGKLHGLNLVYNDNKELVRESLYLNNRQKIYLAYQKKKNYIKKLAYIVNNGKAKGVGQMVIKETGNIDYDLTYYYQIFIEEDTVKLGEIIKSSIVPVIGNCNEECYIEIEMGEFDDTFTMINKSEVEEFELNNLDTLLYDHKADKVGINLIMGRMSVRSRIDGSLLGELYIYRDYYVEFSD